MNAPLGRWCFPWELAGGVNRTIIGLAEEHRVDILTYEDSRIITNNAECPYGKLESRINSMEVVEKADLASYVDFPVPKFLMMDDGDYLAMVGPRVKAALGKNFSVYRSEPIFPGDPSQGHR